ncbi:hypothetical protein [Chitinolyticbacter meiyuanensis]|uniref:hypothetical protein n=1 Tax=Chitinolyticbacter meiyuanensis TaxID=682798 RepID=UPI0011E5CDBD|nr:hypothetical protein [Chitinolyticbacter meiyuanensis]
MNDGGNREQQAKRKRSFADSSSYKVTKPAEQSSPGRNTHPDQDRVLSGSFRDRLIMSGNSQGTTPKPRRQAKQTLKKGYAPLTFVSSATSSSGPLNLPPFKAPKSIASSSTSGQYQPKPSGQGNSSSKNAFPSYAPKSTSKIVRPTFQPLQIQSDPISTSTGLGGGLGMPKPSSSNSSFQQPTSSSSPYHFPVIDTAKKTTGQKPNTNWSSIPTPNQASTSFASIAQPVDSSAQTAEKRLRTLPKAEGIWEKIEKRSAQTGHDANQQRLLSAMKEAKANFDRDAHDSSLQKGWKNEARQYYSYYKKYSKMTQEQKKSRAYYPQVGLGDYANKTKGRKPDMLKLVRKENGEIKRTMLEFKSGGLTTDAQTQVKDTLKMLRSPTAGYSTTPSVKGSFKSVTNLGNMSYKVVFAEHTKGGNVHEGMRADLDNESKGSLKVGFAFSGVHKK